MYCERIFHNKYVLLYEEKLSIMFISVEKSEAIHGYPYLCSLKILTQKSTSEIGHFICNGEDDVRKLLCLVRKPQSTF